MTGDEPGRPALRCAECGERVKQGRSPGSFVHASRTIAACDLDSDHLADPDWRALGEVPCRRCGAPSSARLDTFVHLDPAREADHAADPLLPLL